MHFNLRVCSRARLARDARFDGKIFVGLLNTRIYCRPVCRSSTAKEKNVRYFPAAAEEAGFARVCAAGRNAHPVPQHGWKRPAPFRARCG
jgi:AraC family transcriptional regulator of adaptative response / DNA-3-methyladenine glycosylase II